MVAVAGQMQVVVGCCMSCDMFVMYLTGTVVYLVRVQYVMYPYQVVVMCNL